MYNDDGVTRETLAAELDRICESVAFRHSHQHQQFLRHLIDCKLAGRLSALREIALAIDFFRRPASTYDPKVDAVVRVEAGRLRQRLDRYYHGEGAGAPFEISLAKGSYLPMFRLRAAAATAAGALPCVAVLPLQAATVEQADVQWAAALAEEILQTLSRLPHVRVLRPESSVAADVATSPHSARTQLKVMWIVCGRWLDGASRKFALEVVDTSTDDRLLSVCIPLQPTRLHCTPEFVTSCFTALPRSPRLATAPNPTQRLASRRLHRRGTSRPSTSTSAHATC